MVYIKGRAWYWCAVFRFRWPVMQIVTMYIYISRNNQWLYKEFTRNSCGLWFAIFVVRNILVFWLVEMAIRSLRYIVICTRIPTLENQSYSNMAHNFSRTLRQMSWACDVVGEMLPFFIDRIILDLDMSVHESSMFLSGRNLHVKYHGVLTSRVGVIKRSIIRR